MSVMRRVKGRRSSEISPQELASGLNKISKEGQGVWDISIYLPEHALSLTLSPLEKDRQALRFIASGLAGLADMPEGVPCLICDQTVTNANIGAIVVARAYHDRPTLACFNAICERCADGQSPEEMGLKVTDIYHKVLGGRVIFAHRPEPQDLAH